MVVAFHSKNMHRVDMESEVLSKVHFALYSDNKLILLEFSLSATVNSKQFFVLSVCVCVGDSSAHR